MWLRNDQISKQLACAMLGDSGTTISDIEVAPDAQRADLFHDPDPARRAHRDKLGLLARLAATPCLIEVFSSTPRAGVVRGCVRKHLNFWHARDLEAQKKKQPATAPMLWILTTGRPVSAIRAFAFVPARGFPRGVYRTSGWTRVGLVVTSELPRERSTLLVRLLAGGRGLPEAMKDLSALPPDAPEHALATPVLLSFTTKLSSKHRPTHEEQEFIMATQNIVQELVEKGRREALRELQELAEKGRLEGQREGRLEGQREGRLEGQREALREVEKRVEEGRRDALREGRLEGRLKEARAALRSVLTKRGLTPSAEDEAKIDACTRTATLRRWHDQAIDAATAAEALK